MDLAADLSDPKRSVSLPSAHRSVAIPAHGSFWRKLAAFVGPGWLVAVGYMDPGNWATDLAGGSRYGYSLLWVIVVSNLMAMLLQGLAAKLGIVTGRDLAQACRERYSPSVRVPLWLLAEGAIIACDLAEVIGTGIALELLFHIPLPLGVWLTALNVLAATLLERRGFRRLEALVAGLMVVVAASLCTELFMSRLDIAAVGRGLLPTYVALADPGMLYISAGIIGATVMPHNLYLHSALVQTRRFRQDVAGKREAIRFATLDGVIALSFAMLANAAILMLAASVFHHSGQDTVSELDQAYRLLSPMLGVGLASTLFGVALLASGQNSTLTGALAGQVVMEGFTDFRMSVRTRRAITRCVAIVPAAAVATIYGGEGTGKLLVLSQVLLSLQLPFAVIPLIAITGDRASMGEFANRLHLQVGACAIAALICGLGLWLLYRMAA